MKLTMLRAGIPVLACMFFVSIGFADVIAVNNPSFEILPPAGLPFDSCGAGCFFSEATIPGQEIPGWTGGTSSFGQFQPGTQDGNFTFFDTLSDGITHAFVNGDKISQTVGATVQVGVTYTLKIDLGERNDSAFLGSADLLVGGVTVIPAVGLAPTPGNWSTFTASFIGLPTEAGESITVELHSAGIQGSFDNVRLSNNLTTAAVPEPNSFVLLGAAVLGIAIWRCRRFKQLA